MNPLVTVRGNQLVINGNILDFDGEVRDMLIMDHQIIVVYINYKSPVIDNVCSIDFNGNIRWRIQNVTALDKELKSWTYVGLIKRKDGLYQANDTWGRRFIFDPETGKLLGRDTTGRDW